MKPSSPVHLPEGVVHEILSKLNIKSIVRFKSASKPWLSLLESRPFINSHTQYHQNHHNDHENQNDHLLFSDDHNKIHRLSPSSNESPELLDLGGLPQSLCHVEEETSVKHEKNPAFSVLGPLSNGVFCLMATGMTNSPLAGRKGFCNAAFCNLATRDFKLTLSPLRWKVDARLISLTKHYYGFGSVVDHKSNTVVDYKMVSIAQIQSPDFFDARVYSLRSCTWNRIVSPPKFEFPRITQDKAFLQPAFINGSCHWMARTPKHGDGDNNVVLQFDMAAEVFGIIQGPPHEYYSKGLDGSYWRVYSGVFVLNDRLAAIIVAHDLNKPRVGIDVWVMMEYGVGKSWNKIHSCLIDIGGDLKRFLGLSFSSETSKDGHGISTIERVFFQHQSQNGQMKLISCGSSNYEEHCEFEWSRVCWNTLGLSNYAETLEPVCSRVTLGRI